MTVIRATGAQQVLVTHGYKAIVARWLQEQGVDAHAIDARFEGEVGDSSDLSDTLEDARTAES
jgi:putative mRNA 3-end processing factor